RVIPVLSTPVVELPAQGGPFVDQMVGVDVHQADWLPITVLAGRLPAPGSTTEVAATTSLLDKLEVAADHARQVLGTGLIVSSPRVDAAAPGQLHSRSF